MNAFQRKMAEHLSLITTLVLDINNRDDSDEELRAYIRIHGHVKKICVDLYSLSYAEGKECINTVFTCHTIMKPERQLKTYLGDCTIEQMVDVLHLIRQALIEGRNHEHHSATDSEHTATTGMDERNGTHGSLLTPAASLCHGSVERTGGQPAGAAPSMA